MANSSSRLLASGTQSLGLWLSLAVHLLVFGAGCASDLDRFRIVQPGDASAHPDGSSVNDGSPRTDGTRGMDAKTATDGANIDGGFGDDSAVAVDAETTDGGNTDSGGSAGTDGGNSASDAGTDAGPSRLDPGLSLPDPSGDTCDYPGGFCPGIEVCRFFTPTEGRCESCEPCGNLNDSCTASDQCDILFMCYLGRCTNFCTLGSYECGPIEDCIDIGHPTRGVCNPNSI